MTVGSPHTTIRSVRVLTVDDQALFRGVARDVIEATPLRCFGISHFVVARKR
jgi:hypothetical protein